MMRNSFVDDVFVSIDRLKDVVVVDDDHRPSTKMNMQMIEKCNQSLRQI